MVMVPISQREFSSKRFKRPPSFSFASKDVLVPLVIQELPRASLVMPIAFAKFGDGFLPVAVQGLVAGKNLFVAPDGRWLARYIPAAYRGYPFALLAAQDGKHVLCIDDACGLISDDEGEPFFDDQDKPSQAINETLTFLEQLATNRKVTERACAALAQCGLIEPFPVVLKSDSNDAEGRELQGLYRVNEPALHKLDPEALHQVHQAGGLSLAYCQLLSMQHMPVLGELAKAHHNAQRNFDIPKTETGELDLTFLADDTTISFENL